MKKKILALTLALALSLSLAACGGKDTPSQDTGSDVPEVNAPEGGAPEGGAPEDDAPEGGGTDAPDASAPEKGGTDSTETETSEEINLSAFYNTLRDGTIWPELMDLTTDANMKELLDSYYPGLAEIAAKQRRVYIAAISAAVGEIALVEVENAEDVQAVEDIFQARIDYQVGDDATPGGAWYPETIEGWKTKSRIVSHGNYVMLAVGDASASAVEEFEALFA